MPRARRSADAAALLSILSGGGSLTVLIVLGGRLFLVLRGRGDDGLQIEADTRAGEPTASSAVHLNGDEVRTRLQLRSRNREGHRGLLGLLGRHAARRNGGVPEGQLGTETCATHFLTVDRHRNGIVRVGGQLQVAACLIAGEVNRGVGVDVVVHAAVTNRNAGVEVARAQADGGAALVPAGGGQILEREVEVVLPRLRAVRCPIGYNVIPGGAVGVSMGLSEAVASGVGRTGEIWTPVEAEKLFEASTARTK